MLVWLDKERAVLQNIQQKIPRGIHCDAHLLFLQRGHDLLIDIARHTRGNTARQNKVVAVRDGVQLFVQQRQRRRNCGPLKPHNPGQIAVAVVQKSQRR